jgi:hypothetical protein
MYQISQMKAIDKFYELNLLVSRVHVSNTKKRQMHYSCFILFSLIYTKKQYIYRQIFLLSLEILNDSSDIKIYCECKEYNDHIMTLISFISKVI